MGGQVGVLPVPARPAADPAVAADSAGARKYTPRAYIFGRIWKYFREFRLSSAPYGVLAWVQRAAGTRARNAPSNFLGCSLGPFPFAITTRCHEKSIFNSAGSSLGPLASPRDTPQLGGAAVSCQYHPRTFYSPPTRPLLFWGLKPPPPPIPLPN